MGIIESPESESKIIATIYTLQCPSKKTIMYIGHTIGSLSERLKQHLFYSKGHNAPLYRYIRDNKIIPIIEPIDHIEAFSKRDILRLESFWIELMKQWGFVLFNQLLYVTINSPKSRQTTIKIDSRLFQIIKAHINGTSQTISGFIEIAIQKQLPKTSKKRLDAL